MTDRNKHLHFLTLDGHITNVLTLPATFGSVETGWRHTYGTVLLGNAGYKMYVMDCEGCILWRYPKWLGVLGGINAAHGGDINGDGNDEVLLGLNVWGGLRAFTSEGKSLWKIKDIGGVWSHTIIPALSDKKALVLATKASGQIYMYDHLGQLLRTLRPNGGYFTDITASVVKSPDCIQIAAIVPREEGSYEVLVFDLEGHVMWKTPATRVFMNRVFACEDMNGDGMREWAFIEKPDELVFVSHQGEKLATLSGQKDIDDFIIVPKSNGFGILVVLQAGMVKAYQFETRDS